MYYRRKILLALIEAFGGQLEKIRLQKLLMLFSKMQKEADYHFIPYKYGCYSFQANADLKTMGKYGQVVEADNQWIKKDLTNYRSTLKERDKQILNSIKLLHESKSSEDLVKHTYIKYPYLAINSSIAKDILSPAEYAKVEEAKPRSNKTILFTIGYEGISLEEYLNKLLANSITVLVDVRNNPLSMKYGFSKSQLSKACEGIGIKYIHLPEVGIESDKRQQLNTQSDYDKLFELYRKKNLKQTQSSQLQILNLLKENKRIALTCFEANICQCHRKHLSEAITKLEGWKYELKHI